MNKNTFAILLIFLSIFFGTSMGTLMKLAQNDLNVYTAGFFRFFLRFFNWSLPYILKTKFNVYNTPNFKIHLIRSCLNLPAMLLGFAALAMIPFEKVSALQFCCAIFCNNISSNFFKRKN